MNEVTEFAISETAPDMIPMELLLEADESEEVIASYLNRSRCFAARNEDGIVGAVVISDLEPNVLEVMNIAVDADFRGVGIGRNLLEQVIAFARSAAYKRIVIKTGTVSFSALALYQKLGFRMIQIHSDAFFRTYEEPIIEHNIVCRDQVELEYCIYSKQQCTAAADRYFSACCRKLPRLQGRTYTVWGFGYGEYVPNYLLALVKQGMKKGTSSAYELYGKDEPIPEVGDLSVLTYGNGMPGALVETVDVMIKPFREIGEREALLEGEGDSSVSYWRNVHERFFSQEYHDQGLSFHTDIPVVFEQFQVICRQDGELPDFPSYS